MSKEKFIAHVFKLPPCDICKDGTEAAYDARLPYPYHSWAYVCEKHFKEFGCTLGVGYGHKLMKVSDSK